MVIHTYQLPIYTLCGPHTQEKQKFLIDLAENFRRRRLSTGIISRTTYRFYEHELDQEIYQRLLVNDLVLIDCLKTEKMPVGDNTNQEHLPALAIPWNNALQQKKGLGVHDCVQEIYAHLENLNKNAPVQGCILIGGKSSRMGSPKHLLTNNNKQTWLEVIYDQLAPFVEQVYVSGAGELPGGVQLPRIHDVEGIHGPLAGLLAAFKTNPYHNWLFIACDMPLLSQEAISWLLKQRGPGRWAIFADLTMEGRVEPFPSYHDFRMRSFWEQLARNPRYRLTEVAAFARAYIQNPPTTLIPAWENINTPENIK